MNIRKWIIACCLLCGLDFNAGAQNIGAMLEQIAALKLYIGTAEKGYQIVEDGLNTVQKVKDAEFGLHGTYFHSLATVNPSVKNMPQVGEIIGLQAVLVKEFSDAMKQYGQSPWLNANELAYSRKVYAGLVDLTTADLTCLLDLLTDGNLDMEDGERLWRIQELYEDEQALYGFVQAYTQRTGLLIRQRQEEFANLGILK